jgi:hypothetical protein
MGAVSPAATATLGDLSGVPRSALWQAMNMIGMVESRREVNGKVTTATRFYIGSTGTDVGCFARAARGHWGIEAVLRHIALTRLKQDQRTKLGIQNKRLNAGWDERYLAELLVAPPHSTTGTGPSGPANISGT